MKTTVYNIGQDFLAATLALILIISGFKPVHSQATPEVIALGTSAELFNEELMGRELPAGSEYMTYYEEEELQVEEWMSDDIYWGSEVIEEEEPNKLLPWMWCDYYWSGKLCKELLNEKVELESELHVEAWMYDDNYWK